MPFLRFSRDRRGYENTFLLHAARPRGERDRPRLLYWFRTPPHLKVGRTPFDEEAIRLLEDAHPEVEFDWSRLLETSAIDWNDQPEGTPDNPQRPPDSTAGVGGDSSFRSASRRRRRRGGRGPGA